MTRHGRNREWLRQKEREAPAEGEVKLPPLPRSVAVEKPAPSKYLIRAVVVHLGRSEFFILRKCTYFEKFPNQKCTEMAQKVFLVPIPRGN